jgi:hypothetical protein
MHIQSGRQIAALWAGALLIFLASALGSTALLPTTPVTRPTASYYVGLAGLLVIGIALVLTWMWVRRTGPASRGTRAVLQILLAIGGVLWLAAMVFPFL